MKNNLPAIIIWDEVALPKVHIEIEISTSHSLNAILKSKKEHEGYVILISQKNVNVKEPILSDLETIGTLAKIIKTSEEGNDSITVTFNPVERVEMLSFKRKGKINISEYEVKKSPKKLSKKEEETAEELVRYVELKLENSSLPPALLKPLLDKKNMAEICDAIASYLPIEINIKQQILNTINFNERMLLVIHLLKEDMSSSKVDNDIQSRVKGKLNDQQREFYLREKAKAIKEEIDKISGQESEIEELRKRLDSNPYPKEIKEKITKELTKLEASMPISSEANVIRTYVDWLLELPYWQKDNETIDINKVKKELNKEHYGLEKVKDSIIEFLAVKQMNPNSKGTVLALVGPPGTGKTTLAKSIAKSLDRKYVKVSLGGVRDESEMRGHRRTYIAAMPGKIISAMKKAKVINPIILLDEIDKMSSDLRGDPASALLEVLDYEQNEQFQDHYIEEEYDLSNVMFITTANYYENIPEPLLDRLDIIELSSYTEMEKQKIAEKHLIKAVIKNTNLDKKLFNLNSEIIRYIIRHYTREAGVRGLRRVMDKLSRKIVVDILNGKIKNSLVIDKELINKYLGPEKYDYSKKEKESQVGIATGLAWTSVGGDILPIEVQKFPGEGKLVISGQLKDVMQESATLALAYVKANAESFGIDSKIFKENDFHIHVPDGSTPKDGPSAGITFTTAIISAITDKPISSVIGMTGEITLHGKIFPIGGLKEKSISASRSGLKTILIPKENMKDLIDIPAEVKKKLEIIPVEKYQDVYDKMFVN